MLLKYDKLRLYWTVVTEKKRLKSVYTDYRGIIPLRWNSINDKSAFSPVIDIFEK